VKLSLKAVLLALLALRARLRDRLVRKRGIDTLAVVAIFRQEAPFLDEWLEFHRAMGVGHFYLYNNFSLDDFRVVLAPWIERGLVTLRDWPVQTGQLAAYRHCVKHHAMDAQWMAFIDIDEFLFSPAGRNLVDVLRPYRDLPGLFLDSPFFGSAGHAQRPPRPIGASFTKRAPLRKITAKSIANPRWIYAIRNVHIFKYFRGEALNMSRESLENRVPRLDSLRLNHYWSRSLADLTDKIARGDASTPDMRDPQWHFDFERELNAEEDLSIVPVLKRSGMLSDAGRE